METDLIEAQPITGMTIPSRAAAPDEPAVARTEAVTKRFGDDAVIQDLSFAVPPGTIFGLIGPSGSGKTTTVRLLTGIYAPSEGRVMVLGQDPQHFTAAVRADLGYMPQNFVLYPELSVWENMNFSASLYGMGLRRGRRLRELLEFVELDQHRHKLARSISSGMQRRLALAATLAHRPKLIFLDEPTAGIDPILRRKFWDYFRELRQGGRTVFVTTQYVGEAAYCDLVGIMAEGRMLMVETPDGLRKRTFGGELVDLQASQPLDYRTVTQIRALPFVVGRLEPLGESGLRVVVDDAATAIPALIDWARNNDLDVTSAEKYDPPLDDVFVEAIKRDQASG